METRYSLSYIKTNHPRIHKRIMEIMGPKYREEWESFTVQSLFLWEATLEGGDFWSQINDGNYDIFYRRYPESKVPAKSIDKIPIKSITISDLFEQKVRELHNTPSVEITCFKEGDKVHYKRLSFVENGIVKSIEDNGNAFVVYKWGDKEEDFRNFTGVLTSLKYLKKGWYDNIHPERSTLESIRDKQEV